MITGSVLLAFGLGWGLMAVLTTRFSAQPQTWMAVPAVFLGSVGLGLIVLQPGPRAMDLLSWVWPPALAILAIWMVAQVRRKLRGRGRWLVVPVIATLLVFAVGGAIATRRCDHGRRRTGASATAPAGRMIDVGGHRLYIECTGTGSPTVVLQAGLGESSSSWARIAPAVAASTTVCAYDRAGHGRSDEAAAPQDGIALATDLHTLLDAPIVAGPYVLVGHSSGGAYVRVFADPIPTRSPAWSCSTPSRPTRSRRCPTTPRPIGSSEPSTLSQSLARIGLLGPVLGLPADQSTPAAARGARDEVVRPARGPAAGAGARDARRSATHRRHGRIRAAGRLARSAGPVAGSLDEQQPSRPGRRHPHLAHHRRRRRGVQPGDPRRRRVAPDRDGGPMNAPSASLLTEVGRSIPAIAVDRRLARAVVATLVIGGYMALGFAFRLSAEGYLLVGIPITVAFQVTGRPTTAPGALARGTPTHDLHAAVDRGGRRSSRSPRPSSSSVAFETATRSWSPTGSPPCSAPSAPSTRCEPWTATPCARRSGPP